MIVGSISANHFLISLAPKTHASTLGLAREEATGSYFQRPRQVLDRLFRLVLPTLDNLRNFLLTPTTEVLSFFQTGGRSSLAQRDSASIES